MPSLRTLVVLTGAASPRERPRHLRGLTGCGRGTGSRSGTRRLRRDGVVRHSTVPPEPDESVEPMPPPRFGR